MQEGLIPMTVTNGDILRVDLFYSLLQNVVGQHVFHYEYTDNTTRPDQEVVDDMKELAIAWAVLWRPLASTAETVSSVSVSLRGAGGKFLPIGQANINIAGTSAQAVLPQGVALLLRGTVVGSSGQSRKFIPGLVASVCPNGVWNASALTLGADLALLYVSDLTQLPAVNGDYQPGTFVVSTGILKPLTGTVFVNVEANYQRRRRPGVGI